MWPTRWAGTVLSKGFGHLLFPSHCAICDADDGPICPSCRAEMSESGPQCPRCALTVGLWADLTKGCSVCRDRSLGFDAAIAIGPYQGSIRNLCIRLKDVRSAWLASWATRVLVESRGEQLRALQADLVVPVPLHWRRHLRRGYNQSQALATELASALNLPLRNVLTRTSPTPKLARKRRSERLVMMKNAFRPRSKVDLRGKTVLLVDDILTTGATCGASARALKAAGANQVIAVVLARAEGLV